MDDLRWMWSSPFTWRIDATRSWTVQEYEEMVEIGWGRSAIGFTRWMTQPESMSSWWLVYVDFTSGRGIAARPWSFAVAAWLVHAIDRLNNWALYTVWRLGYLRVEEGMIARWRDVKISKVRRA